MTEPPFPEVMNTQWAVIEDHGYHTALVWQVTPRTVTVGPYGWRGGLTRRPRRMVLAAFDDLGDAEAMADGLEIRRALEVAALVVGRCALEVAA